jgi:hypothetical protein
MALAVAAITLWVGLFTVVADWALTLWEENR